MRLPRPYIPIDVRIKVAARQLGHDWNIRGQSRTEKLRLMLKKLFPNGEAYDLDHDPALENREQLGYWDSDKQDFVITGYRPDANDPDYLKYRERYLDHKIKTLVRGDGAQYSDAALARKNKRIAKSRSDKPTRKIQSRNQWGR